MIRVITADVSAVARSIEKQIFALNKEFDLLTSVGDSKTLLEKCKTLHPDLVIASLDIPEIKNTIKTLSLEEKTRVIVLDSKSTEKDNFPGVSKMEKPDFVSMNQQKMEEFSNSIKTLYVLSNKKNGNNNLSYDSSIFLQKRPFEILLVGVSTGGPKSLQVLLENLGNDFPLPILVTQHIDTTFDKNMVSWINKTVKIPSSLAEDNEVLKNGHVYFAPADCHLTLKKKDKKILINLDKSEPINFLRPSVDKMFESAANIYKDGCLAILLTGMGNDGTRGCSKIKKVGGYTIGESEETCVVFGMPKSAYDAGFIDEMLPLYDIGKRVNALTQRRCK